MGKLPEAKQAGGGTIQQPVSGGGCTCHLLTEPVPQLPRGTGFAERDRQGSRDADHRVLLEGTWQRVAGEGGGSGKEKAPDLFPIFPHIKLFPCPLIMLHCRCCLCLSQMLNYLPSKDYEERLHGASKGSAPRSPSSVLLKKEESFPLESCWHLV